MELIKYGLTDSHSDTIFCLANSVEELDEEFNLTNYRVTKLIYIDDFESGGGHKLMKKEFLNTPI